MGRFARGGADRVTRRFDTQQEAIEAARKIARKQGAELYIHGKDGLNPRARLLRRRSIPTAWIGTKLADPDFSRNVFINCPFDEEYEPILQAILFCLVSLGLRPRIATERSDAGEPRVEKIIQLIRSARYSVHDLSRCQARQRGEHYRLNMPFELGLDFGCRRYGGDPYSEKVILILEEQRYRYQEAISDLAGSDIEAHQGDYNQAVRKGAKLDCHAGRNRLVPAPHGSWHSMRTSRRGTTNDSALAGFSDDDIRDYSYPRTP